MSSILNVGNKLFKQKLNITKHCIEIVLTLTAVNKTMQKDNIST